MVMVSDVIREHIREVRDFPIEGIGFKDIGPLLGNPQAFGLVIHGLANRYDGTVDVVAALDARGFVFGAPLAHRLGVPFVMIRKAGKLPGKTEHISYDVEYGTAELEIQLDAFPLGSRVLVVDDVLAMGGTANAACTLIEQVGGTVVACAFVIELAFLGGQAKLDRYPVHSLVVYE